MDNRDGTSSSLIFVPPPPPPPAEPIIFTSNAANRASKVDEEVEDGAVDDMLKFVVGVGVVRLVLVLTIVKSEQQAAACVGWIERRR